VNKYKFLPAVEGMVDPKFHGLMWELQYYDDTPYMDGGQFSIEVKKINSHYFSMSKKELRKGTFVEVVG